MESEASEERGHVIQRKKMGIAGGGTRSSSWFQSNSSGQCVSAAGTVVYIGVVGALGLSFASRDRAKAVVWQDPMRER
jgi:hypothetical protein